MVWGKDVEMKVMLLTLVFMLHFGTLYDTLQGKVNTNRALNCTRAMAAKYLDELAEIIKTNYQKFAPGISDGQNRLKADLHTPILSSDKLCFES